MYGATVLNGIVVTEVPTGAAADAGTGAAAGIGAGAGIWLGALGNVGTAGAKTSGVGGVMLSCARADVTLDDGGC